MSRPRFVPAALLLAAALLVPATFGAAYAQDAKKPKDASAAIKDMAGKKDLVDINTASRADLIKLPGIGETYADKIIAGRPFARKDELVSKGILPDGIYQKVAPLIIAKQLAK